MLTIGSFLTAQISVWSWALSPTFTAVPIILVFQLTTQKDQYFERSKRLQLPSGELVATQSHLKTGPFGPLTGYLKYSLNHPKFWGKLQLCTIMSKFFHFERKRRWRRKNQPHFVSFKKDYHKGLLASSD